MSKRGAIASRHRISTLTHRSHTHQVAASVLAGVGYGLNFDPPQYIKNNVAGSPQNLLDYVFPHFTGILLTTLFYFVVYALWCVSA